MSIEEDLIGSALDDAPGSGIRLEGMEKRWTRTKGGCWHEEPLAEEKKPWWKFW